MSSFDKWMVVPAMVIPVALPMSAFAVQYMDESQAQKLLFQMADGFVPQNLTLSATQRQAIVAASGVPVRASEMRVSRVMQGGKSLGWVIFDEVYGKHELINYAVGIGENGAVAGVEILNYREARGNEVKNAKWRAQFTGKKASDTVRLDQDIKNISGATLSCQHVTDGVRRLLATYAVALK